MARGKVLKNGPFTFADRLLIQKMLKEGHSYSFIGEQLGYNRIRISQEVHAATPDINRGSFYRADLAHAVQRGSFTYAERVLIEKMLQEGCSYRFIGERLGYEHTIIAREVQASTPNLSRGVFYRAELAQALQDARYFRRFINVRGDQELPLFENFDDREVAALAESDEYHFDRMED